eukprot:7376854-Prymnesium_polylepis.1
MPYMSRQLPSLARTAQPDSAHNGDGTSERGAEGGYALWHVGKRLARDVDLCLGAIVDCPKSQVFTLHFALSRTTCGGRVDFIRAQLRAHTAVIHLIIDIHSKAYSCTVKP